jgi:hypothetical protein
MTKAFLSDGRVCAGASLLASIAAILFAFPGAIVPALIFSGIISLFGLFCVALHMGLSNFFAKFRVIGVAAFWIAGAAAFAFVIHFMAVGIWKTLHGLPVDQYGTVIPITATGIVVIAAAYALGAACFYRHVMMPNSTEATAPEVFKKFPRTISFAMSLAIFLFVGYVTVLATYVVAANGNPEFKEHVRQERLKELGIKN